MGKDSMVRGAALAAAAAAVLVAAGCGSSDSPDPAPATTTTEAVQAAATTTTPTTTAAAPSTSPRGNVIGAIGRDSGVRNAAGDAVIKWKVTGIQADAPCTTSIAIPPVNGHIVIATMEAETSPAFDPTSFPGGFHPANNWSIVNDDGFTQPSATSDASTYCIPKEWPDLVPGSKYRFQVAFDSQTPTGILQFRLPGDPTGWEWGF